MGFIIALHLLVIMPHEQCLEPDEQGIVMCQICEFRHHHPLTQACRTEPLVETMLRNLTLPPEAPILVTVDWRASRASPA